MLVQPKIEFGGTSQISELPEHRGFDLRRCHTEPLPTVNPEACSYRAGTSFASLERISTGVPDLDDIVRSSTTPEGKTVRFDIDQRRREGLLQGLDEVMMTLQRDQEIQAFQEADRAARPWIHFARKLA